MSTAYEMPAENRGISFPVRNMRGVARPMRVNLVPAPLQFRIRAFSWPRNMPWDLRGKNFHPVSVYGGGWFRWRTWTEEIETLISGYFPYPFFSRTFKYSLPFGLGNIQGSNVYFFLELWKGRRIIDSDNRFMEVFIFCSFLWQNREEFLFVFRFGINFLNF